MQTMTNRNRNFTTPNWHLNTMPVLRHCLWVIHREYDVVQKIGTSPDWKSFLPNTRLQEKLLHFDVSWKCEKKFSHSSVSGLTFYEMRRCVVTFPTFRGIMAPLSSVIKLSKKKDCFNLTDENATIFRNVERHQQQSDTCPKIPVLSEKVTN